MQRPARMGNGVEKWGIPEVQKRFGVERPEQVIDFLGMMGDAADNIPGLPGVGEKTAKKFLQQFGSMEALLENTDQLKGKMKEKIEDNAELGRLSKKLATIITDCDVTFDETKYEVSPPNVEKVLDIFKELEFRRLTDQFVKMYNKGEAATLDTSQNASSSSQTAGAGQFSLFGTIPMHPILILAIFDGYKTLKTTDHHYQYIKGDLSLKLFIEKLMRQNSVCFDTETTSLKTLDAELVGIAFSWENHRGYYVAFPEDQNEAQELAEKLRPFFESTKIEK